MACIIIPPPPQYFTVECHIIPTKYLKYQQKIMKEIAGFQCKNAKKNPRALLARIHRLSRCGPVAGSLTVRHL